MSTENSPPAVFFAQTYMEQAYLTKFSGNSLKTEEISSITRSESEKSVMPNFEDDVCVSFISNGQEANVYRELLIASASLQELDSAPKSITIPDELMENAGIMPDADIQIICGQGVILITAQASMSTSELREVPQSLYLQYFI